MRERQPMTQILTSSQARSGWSKVLDQVYRDKMRVVVEKSGIPVAAIISPDDLERYRRLEEQRTADFSIFDEVGALFRNDDPDVIEREIGKAIAEVRAERAVSNQASAKRE